MKVLGLCLYYLKRDFQEHQLSAFFFKAQITQILLVLEKLVLKRSKITVWEWQLFKTAFAVKVLGICLPYVKRYFQEHQLSVFFSMDQITQILLFSEMPLLERFKITVREQHIFKKKNCYESFRFASTLREKIFSRATVNCFSMAQITQILFLFGMPPLERSKITVWERHLFKTKKKLAMEVLRLCLQYVKRYFQEHEWSAFLFMAQINQILLFLGMQLLGRSKTTV